MRRLSGAHIVGRVWRSALGLAVVIALLAVVRPAPHLVSLGPQQVVTGTNPLAGVHTRFVDEAEEWKIQRGLSMVREMGAPWVVEFFPWPYYEPQQGHFDWRSADRIIDHANRQGLKVIARLGFVPEWARPAKDANDQPTTFTYLDEANYADFAAFSAAFAAHFKGRVNHIIVWNEPNLTGEWGLRPVDPLGYVRMLQTVYPAIKQANPEVMVLAGALAPTLEPEGSTQGLNDLIYLQKMYAALGQRKNRPYDAWAVHSYGRAAPPEEAPAPDRINYRRTELLRQIMVEQGDAALPMLITEAGWNDDSHWAYGVSPAKRIEYTLAAWDYAKANWPYVQCVAMWVFKLPVPAHGYRDRFTFITPSLEPLPIYDEAKQHLATGR